MSSLFPLIISLVAFGLLILAALIIFGRLKAKGQLERALGMSLFSVTLPREQAIAQGATQRPEKEMISVMEQFLSSFSNLHDKGWNKFIYGEPYVVLEMAVQHVGEETHFFVSVPRSYENIFEKQLHGFFPSAEVTKVKDYNIFDPNGVAVGAYLKLQKDEILPFKTYQKLEADPLNELLTSLSKLQEEGEGASIQLLIRPSHRDSLKKLAGKTAGEMQYGHDFKTALNRAKNPPKKKKEGEEEKEHPRPLTPFGEDTIRALQSKSSKQTFDTNIRVIVSALNEMRAKQIFSDIEGAFTQYGAPDLNSFRIVHQKGSALSSLIYKFVFRIFDERQANYLSTEEIASLFHFPISTTQAPKVKFLKSKSAEPPPNLPKEGVKLGISTYRGREIPIRMTDEDRRRHMYIIGQTGTGKTTMMKAMVRQDIENGKGVCVIDPHGDLAEFTLSIVPKERAEDVIYFDPGELERPLGLNMLEMDPKHPEQKTMIIDELFGIMDKLYNLKETGGPMFEKYFKNSIYLLLDDYEHEIPTISDISRILNDDDYRADKLSRETNPLVKEFWQLEAEKATGEQSLSNFSPYITSKLNNFVFNEFLRPIINQKKSAFNFRNMMDNQKILVVNLSKGRIGDLNANFLGMLVVGKLLRASLSRVDVPENERKDFYVYMDEFQSFTTESIAVILSEARKYRLNLILAHQFIKQLKEEIKNAVFGNVGSIASFRISPDDAEFMKNKFDPVFSAHDLINIDNLNAFVSLLINGQTARPFNVSVERGLVFDVGSMETAKAIKELSSSKYGRPREEVEREIMKTRNL